MLTSETSATGALLLSRRGNMASWTSLWVAKQDVRDFVLLAPGTVFAYEWTVLNLNISHPKELVLSPNKISNFPEIWREGKFIHKIMTVNCGSATYIWVLKTAVKFPTVTQTTIDNREMCLCAKLSGMYAVIKFMTDFKTKNIQIIGTPWKGWVKKNLLILFVFCISVNKTASSKTQLSKILYSNCFHWTLGPRILRDSDVTHTKEYRIPAPNNLQYKPLNH